MSYVILLKFILATVSTHPPQPVPPSSVAPHQERARPSVKARMLCERFGDLSKNLLHTASETTHKALQDELIGASARLMGYCATARNSNTHQIINELNSLKRLIQSIN